jgi:hypothetical protein
MAVGDAGREVAVIHVFDAPRGLVWTVRTTGKGLGTAAAGLVGAFDRLAETLEM